MCKLKEKPRPAVSGGLSFCRANKNSYPRLCSPIHFYECSHQLALVPVGRGSASINADLHPPKGALSKLRLANALPKVSPNLKFAYNLNNWDSLLNAPGAGFCFILIFFHKSFVFPPKSPKLPTFLASPVASTCSLHPHQSRST